MGKISIKDNELVALLPKHLRESKLTGAAKLILGDLLFLYGRDFAKENGFVFRTNQDLMNDTGIKCEGTLIKALRKLEIEGFISRTSGKRNKASEYRLNMDKIKDKHTVNEIHSNNENSNHSVSDSNHSKTETDVMNSRLERIENLLSTKLDTIIEILQKIHYDNNEVITMINGLNRNSNHSVSDSNHSTDKETESHKESSNNILQIDLSSITSEEIDHLDNFLKKKIIKEKAKYMKDNKISRPEVNVVANSENNGMNDNTNKKPNSDLIEDSGDDLKSRKMSNKKSNSDHHKELTKRDNILCKIDDHKDLSSIPENNLFLNILENNTKYMKDNKISRPEVNVVANSENNGMNDNTKNNNSTPDHQHTDTTVSPTSESHSHNECTVPSVDGKNNISGPSGPNGPLSRKNNNIQPLQVPASDTSDTSTVPLSGDGGIGGMVPSVEENNIQPVQVRTSDALDTPTVPLSGNEGIVTTHTIPTVNGTETLQHPAYSSAKPSKICVKKGAAAVGGGDFGAAQKGGETASNTPTVEQLPTSTEITQNTAPSYSHTASNTEFDMFYAQYGCTREEYEEIQRSFHKSNWRSLPCKFKGQTIPLSKALGKLNEENKEGKKPLEANTYFFIVDRLNACANRHVKEGNMNDTEFQEFQNAIEFESRRFFAYWTKTFENRKPYEERPSEKRMYDHLVQMGRIGEKQTEKTDITSIPTVNTVDTDFEDEMAYLDFESGTMTKKRSTTA